MAGTYSICVSIDYYQIHSTVPLSRRWHMARSLARSLHVVHMNRSIQADQVLGMGKFGSNCYPTTCHSRQYDFIHCYIIIRLNSMVLLVLFRLIPIRAGWWWLSCLYDQRLYCGSSVCGLLGFDDDPIVEKSEWRWHKESWPDNLIAPISDERSGDIFSGQGAAIYNANCNIIRMHLAIHLF